MVPAGKSIPILCILIALTPTLFAGSLTVTVKDPAGAMVADAAVELSSQSGAPIRTLPAGNNGRATFDPLPAGDYRVAVTKPGFDRAEVRVAIADRAVDLAVSLKLGATSASVRVSARRSPLANSDPDYQGLRHNRLVHVYRVSNLTLNRDTGVFTFRSGSFSFLPPVQGSVTTGVFIGEGNFRLDTSDPLKRRRLLKMMGSETVSEDFTALVVFFSDSTFDDIKRHSETVDESPVKHEEALARVRSVIQGRREPREPPSWPRSQWEILLNYEDIPNYDAEVLAEIYNGAGAKSRPGSFRAFLHGTKHGDLRYLLNPHGALPILSGTEEVALLCFDPNSNSDGLWYFSHTLAELQSGRIEPKEEKRLIVPEHYRLEVLIPDRNALGAQADLAVICALRFHAAEEGVRMVKFDLIPDFQISRVAWPGNGAEIPFVQEDRKHDGSFYLQMPEPLAKGRSYEVSFELSGPPRGNWYPVPAGSRTQATYDLTFRAPHGTKVVAAGRPVGQTREGHWDVSEWKCDVPVSRADYLWFEDSAPRTAVEPTTDLRTSLYYALTGRGLSPPSKSDMLNDTTNTLRLFGTWFGKPAYDGITVVVRSGRGGGSWPGVVQVPPAFAAGFDSVSSQTAVLSGGRGGAPPPDMRAAFDEVFPRLMASQWWGNTITPATFHDQWIATGLAGFSAALYDLAAANGNFRDRWDEAREKVLTQNRRGGGIPNDAGPVTNGLLNDTPDAPFASPALWDAKGAFVAHMLCSLMWDPQTFDRDFQATMHDFVGQFAGRSVSTEDFQTVVEKHMKPAMDLEGNGRMDWFFKEWLSSTDVPSYHLEYSLRAGGNGATILEGKLTQSGVSPSFRMAVPIFGDYAGKKGRICLVATHGNSTSNFKVSLVTRPGKILLNVNHDVLTRKDEVILAKP
jgi:hypothetical protein